MKGPMAETGSNLNPFHRGPRPLGPHLTTATGILLSSLAALPSARQSSLPWHPKLAAEAASLGADLQKTDFATLSATLGTAVHGRIATYMDGLRRYQAHPYHREVTEPPLAWREGSTRLLDYGRNAEDIPVVFVPSLVNRAYILDLSERRSLMRYLAAAGIRPWLLDWGPPGGVELGYGLNDYIARLHRAIAAATAEAGRPPVLVGYCMGGNLALGAAARRPESVAALGLLATPWDFHAGTPTGFRVFGTFRHGVAATLKAAQGMPVDMLQLLFLSLDPTLGLRKFSAFAAMDPDSPEAADFVALEDWLNDGVSLSAPVAEECLSGWYGDNLPGLGRWQVEGVPVEPARLSLPALVMVPGEDRIVPPASALALAEGPQAIPAALVHRPALGHVGMIVGSRAEADVWQPLRDWILAQGRPKPLPRRRTQGYGARKHPPFSKGATP